MFGATATATTTTAAAATLLKFGDIPSILEIELPAILFNDSLYIELNGSSSSSFSQLDINGSQSSWYNSSSNSSTSNASDINNNNSTKGISSNDSSNAGSNLTRLEEEQRLADVRAAAEFWLLVQMIAMAVVLGLMILVTIIGKYKHYPLYEKVYQKYISLPLKAAAVVIVG